MCVTILLELRKRFSKKTVNVELVGVVGNDEANEISKFNQRSKYWKYLPRSLQPDDLEWQWNRIANRIRDGTDEKWVMVRKAAPGSAKNQVLGCLVLMWLPSAENPSVNVAYIKLIAVHPKHRSLDFGFFRFPGQIKGVAFALLHHAQNRAIAKGTNGNIGLHALGRSKNLYLKLGMKRVPKGDDKYGNPYFEGMIK